MKKLTGLLLAVLLMLMPVRVFADGDADTVSLPLCTALVEAQTGMLLGGDQSDLPAAIGSQTKLMTVLLTAEAVADGRLTADTVITVSPSAEGVSGATVWLLGGEQMTVSDLLKAVIIGNANDAATALACRISGSEAAFVMDMNAQAFSLGMRSTRFADCTGLSDENIGTAYDLALLCCALLRHSWLIPLFTTWRDFLRDGATELVSENRLTRTYEGILGMKAGHGDACGQTLTLAAEQDGMRCIAVVLGCGDEDERFALGKQLLAQGFSGYYVTTPDFSTEFLRPVTVRHGIGEAVLAESGDLRAVAVPQRASLSCIVILPQYAEAPVCAGDVLGEIAFYCDDTLLYETPLIAADDVPYRGFRETFCLLLENLFR